MFILAATNRLYHGFRFLHSYILDVVRRGESFQTRMYRNRRLEDFLKELELSEGQGTGIPTIQGDLERLGSPRAVFETDEDRRQLCVTIPINPRYSELIREQSGMVDRNSESTHKNSDLETENSDSTGKNSDLETGNPDYEILKSLYVHK